MTIEPRFHQMIYDARPWYHDFSSLGIQTHFREQTQERTIRGFLSDYSPRYLVDKFFSKPRHYLKKAYAAALRKEKLMKTINVNGGNQQRKEKYILPYLEEAFLSCKSKGVEKPSTLELFCADGYYSFWMQRTHELQNLKALDLNERRIKQAKVMNSILQSDIEFQYMDVYDLSPEERYDVTLCAGGLYHVHDPKRVLELCHTVTRHYVVVQSVISLDSEDEDYFVTPAPGWKHGSRFSNARLRKWIEEVGFEILEHGRDRLDNDAPLSSRGTAYYLCKKIE